MGIKVTFVSVDVVVKREALFKEKVFLLGFLYFYFYISVLITFHSFVLIFISKILSVFATKYQEVFAHLFIILYLYPFMLDEKLKIKSK